MQNVKKLFFLSLLFLPASLSAQSNIIKSPYLLDKHQLCIATMKVGLPLREHFNYNCESQRMEFVDGNGVNMELANTEYVDTLFLGTHKMVPYQQRFLDVCHRSSSFDLLVDYKLKAGNKGKENKGFGVKSQANGIESVDMRALNHIAPQEERYTNLEVWEYTPMHTYYLRQNKKTRHFNNKKSLLKLFPDRQADIEALVAELNTDFSRPAEVTTLLTRLLAE